MTYLIDSFPEICDWAELTGSKGTISEANMLTL